MPWLMGRSHSQSQSLPASSSGFLQSRRRVCILREWKQRLQESAFLPCALQSVLFYASVTSANIPCTSQCWEMGSQCKQCLASGHSGFQQSCELQANSSSCHRLTGQLHLFLEERPGLFWNRQLSSQSPCRFFPAALAPIALNPSLQ